MTRTLPQDGGVLVFKVERAGSVGYQTSERMYSHRESDLFDTKCAGALPVL